MEKKMNAHRLVQLALLVAVELVMTYTPLGYLHIGPLSITFLMIPVVLGSILIGPGAGAILGGVFGLTSFAQCFGAEAFGVVLLGISPVRTFLVCVPTRILAGWLPGLIFRAIWAAEGTRKHWLSFAAASFAGPVLNTLLFMGALLTFFYSTDYIQGMVSTMGASNPLMFAAMFVGVQGVVEALVGFIVCTAISKGVWKPLHRS